MKGFQKIANRITAAEIILAALILGAALLMKVQTTFQIFGYPGLAILWLPGSSRWKRLVVVHRYLLPR